jgi:hypothetical protein
MTERNFGSFLRFWVGRVVNVNDPHESGRVQVRIYSHHDDETNIPNESLPWAQVLQPITSAAIGRIGTAPVGLVVGTRVFGVWLDADMQLPLVLGSLGRAGEVRDNNTKTGIPQIDVNAGSIPLSARNIPNNPYAALETNYERITIDQIDSGRVNIERIEEQKGIVLTTEVENGMRYTDVPTVASGSIDQTDILSLIRSVDQSDRICAIQGLVKQAQRIINEIDITSMGNRLLNNLANNILYNTNDLFQQLGIDKIEKTFEIALRSLGPMDNVLNESNTLTDGQKLLVIIYKKLKNSRIKNVNEPFSTGTTDIRNEGIVISEFPQEPSNPLVKEVNMNMNLIRELISSLNSSRLLQEAENIVNDFKWRAVSSLIGQFNINNLTALFGTNTVMINTFKSVFNPVNFLQKIELQDNLKANRSFVESEAMLYSRSERLSAILKNLR